MNNFWDERYAEEEYAYGLLPNHFLQKQLNDLNPGKILFACEGEGRNAVYAAKLGWDAVAFDLSEEGKKKALKLATENKLTLKYQIVSAEQIQYPEGTFDAVVFIYAHFPESIRYSVHQKALQWLKPQGRVILEAFNPQQLKNTSGGPKLESMLYTKEDISRDFDGLEVLQLTEESIVLAEGKFHQGKADVVRFVGRKRG